MQSPIHRLYDSIFIVHSSFKKDKIVSVYARHKQVKNYLEIYTGAAVTEVFIRTTISYISVFGQHALWTDAWSC